MKNNVLDKIINKLTSKKQMCIIGLQHLITNLVGWVLACFKLMELDIKCRSSRCNFSTKVDWPEDSNGNPLIRISEGLPELTHHHIATRPSLDEYENIAPGHTDFTAEYKGKKFDIYTSAGSAWIMNYREHFKNPNTT